jgi:hypothetical protein
MTTFLARFVQPSIQRTVKRALALRPRGAVLHDVLILNSMHVSGHSLQVEWRARDVHPWDRHLPLSEQADLFSEQALEDTDEAIVRLFKRLPDIERIELQVLNPMASGGVILTGVVDRETALGSEPPPSLRWRLIMLGISFRLVANHLVLLPGKTWGPMVKSGRRKSPLICAS